MVAVLEVGDKTKEKNGDKTNERNRGQRETGSRLALIGGLQVPQAVYS